MDYFTTSWARLVWGRLEADTWFLWVNHKKKEATWKTQAKMERDPNNRQCTYDVILRRVRATAVTVVKYIC
jgi:hypothetical protein